MSMLRVSARQLLPCRCPSRYITGGETKTYAVPVETIQLVRQVECARTPATGATLINLEVKESGAVFVRPIVKPERETVA